MGFSSFLENRNVEHFTQKIIKAAEGYADIMQIGVVDNHQMFKIVINPKGSKTVVFVAGLHGDEEGGPEGVLKFLEERPYIPKTKKVIIIPLANPTGYINNTRENDDEEDLNRKYDKELDGERKAIWDAIVNEDIELFHTLHEAPPMDSFYLYYTHNKKLAEEIRDLASKYFKICDQDSVFDDKMIDGLVPLPHKRKATLEDEIYSYGIPYFTTETPGRVLLSKRSKFTKEMMKLVIHNF